MLTYMASCGDVSCDMFDTSTARWFKIGVQTRELGVVLWPQEASLMNGAPATVNLPSNIAPGGYMIRHEIITLHNATIFNGAEFYPSCAQINVGGSGTGRPTDMELVSLPGAYSDNDPGIFDPAVYDKDQPYIVPGPPIASFVSNNAPPDGPPSNVPPSNGVSTNGVPTDATIGAPWPTISAFTSGAPSSDPTPST
jgi:hypothetical protein